MIDDVLVWNGRVADPAPAKRESFVGAALQRRPLPVATLDLPHFVGLGDRRRAQVAGERREPSGKEAAEAA